ncbi:MAG TPA: TIGR03067 domain-containing protein [Xanthobacteraceae bacterium]|nr:TIGR03067 domain-containing protein [Xanthobacteraceae bacterium]
MARGLISTICACLIYANAFAVALAQSNPQDLQGGWTAVSARQDGKPADNLVGHVLTFTGNSFRIQAKDGKLLYAGTATAQPNTNPAAIDFAITEGAQKGKSWKGIFEIKGSSLTICDNAPDSEKARPSAFETKGGSGYVLVTFQRVNP